MATEAKTTPKRITAKAMDATHPRYDELKGVWEKCRAAVKGQRAIHAGGEKFLPRLTGQTDDQYKAMVKRALYFNATGRTVEAMVGLAFRKAGTKELPGAMKDWERNITMSGISLDGLSRDVLTQAIEVGRIGLLVDHPPAPVMPEGTALTLEQAQALNQRPFVAIYQAESILNWETKVINSVTVLFSLTLAEPFVNAEGKPDTQVRELTIEGGVYKQLVWHKLKAQTDTAKWELVEEITPVKGNKPMAVIPFWFVAPKEKNWTPCDPPIEDLVYVNLSHYMNSADLENGAHISGLPTPYITGIPSDSKTVMNLGTGAAWMIPDPNAKVGFCQVGAEGFSSLEKLMDRKEQQMAAIGARLIAPEKKAAETAETAKIRSSGETSVLADIVRLVSRSLREVLQFMAEWGGIAGKVELKLNTDFLPLGMSSQDLTALLGAVQSGKMSHETFFECLQAGEVVKEGLTFADEKDRIEQDGPPLGTLGNNGNGQ